MSETIDATDKFSPAQKMRAEALTTWWMELAEKEISTLAPKAIEYGAADLQVMGVALKLLLPNQAQNVDPQELAIAFYALGKVARLFGAYAQGEKPSDDCWYDLKVYAGMAQRVRETGVWG